MQKKFNVTPLGVFKGKEARLNRAIFKVLCSSNPLNIYDIYKQLVSAKVSQRLRYGNVNTRVRALENQGYLQKAGAKITKAGFWANLYTITPRVLFALLLNSVDLNSLLLELDEAATISILSTIATQE